MAGNEKSAAVAACGNVNTRLLGNADYVKVAHRFDLLNVHPRIA